MTRDLLALSTAVTVRLWMPLLTHTRQNIIVMAGGNLRSCNAAKKWPTITEIVLIMASNKQATRQTWQPKKLMKILSNLRTFSDLWH